MAILPKIPTIVNITDDILTPTSYITVKVDADRAFSDIKTYRDMYEGSFSASSIYDSYDRQYDRYGRRHALNHHETITAITHILKECIHVNDDRYNYIDALIHGFKNVVHDAESYRNTHQRTQEDLRNANRTLNGVIEKSKTIVVIDWTNEISEWCASSLPSNVWHRVEWPQAWAHYSTKSIIVFDEMKWAALFKLFWVE